MAKKRPKSQKKARRRKEKKRRKRLRELRGLLQKFEVLLLLGSKIMVQTNGGVPTKVDELQNKVIQEMFGYLLEIHGHQKKLFGQLTGMQEAVLGMTNRVVKIGDSHDANQAHQEMISSTYAPQLQEILGRVQQMRQELKEWDKDAKTPLPAKAAGSGK